MRALVSCMDNQNSGLLQGVRRMVPRVLRKTLTISPFYTPECYFAFGILQSLLFEMFTFPMCACWDQNFLSIICRLYHGFLSSLHAKALSLPSVCWTLGTLAFYVRCKVFIRLTTCFVLDQFNACDLFLKISWILILLTYHDLHVSPSSYCFNIMFNHLTCMHIFKIQAQVLDVGISSIQR